MRLRLLAAAAAAVLALAGCGSPGGSVAAGAARPGVPAALAFTGTTLDGRPFDAAALAGRPAVLWFWAPWCATCAGQASTVTDAMAEYGDRLGVVSVGGLGDRAEKEDFVKDLQTGSVTNLDDPDGTLWRRFQVTRESTFVLLDRAGTVVHSGYLDDVEFNQRVKALVG